MKIVSFEDFFDEFGKLTKHRLNMSIYTGKFECACGQSHWYREHSVEIIGDGFNKVVVVCPETERHLTGLKIKTTFGFGFKGFDSIVGTELEDEVDVIALAALRRLIQRH